MAIRMTGMISGLDTESVIKQLMSAQSTKKTKIEQKKTKAEWKQDKWSELNTKIYKLYTEQVSKMRMQKNYLTKKASSSDETFVTATANASAVSGSHVLTVTQLANAQSVTGKKIAATGQTKLTDVNMTKGTIITVKSGSGSSESVKTLEVADGTTIDDLVSTLKNAGLNASFDENQGRFFISSKSSGADNAFSISTSTVDTSSTYSNAKTDLENVYTGSNSNLQKFYNNYASASQKALEKKKAYDNATTGSDEKVTAYDEWQAAEKERQKLISDLGESVEKAKLEEIESDARKKVSENYLNTLVPGNKEYDEIKESVEKSYYKLDDDGNLPATGQREFTDSAKEAAKAAIKQEATNEINEAIKNGTFDVNAQSKEEAIENKYNELIAAKGGEDAAIKDKIENTTDGLIASSITEAKKSAANNYAVSNETGIAEVEAEVEANKSQATDAKNKVLAKAENYGNVYYNMISNGGSGTTTTTGQLGNLGLTDIDGYSLSAGNQEIDGVTISSASDVEYTLDGVKFNDSKNEFTVSGVTYNVKGYKAGQTATITVNNDTDAVYNSIKTFVKEYNTLLTEMAENYYAESARGYEPLTSDEKESMTDDQIKLWEDKIKGSLLRRDDTLGSLMTAMRTALQTSVEVNGKQYSLANFGVTTSSDYKERGLLHIYGDTEDSVYADQEDKLKKALNEDPDLVMNVFTNIADKLHSTMQDKMKATTLSSALTFYNDKQLKNTISDYKDDITAWTKKLKTIEEKYYKQFSAMETALSKLNSQTNSLSGLLGS